MSYSNKDFFSICVHFVSVICKLNQLKAFLVYLSCFNSNRKNIVGFILLKRYRLISSIVCVLVLQQATGINQSTNFEAKLNIFCVTVFF